MLTRGYFFGAETAHELYSNQELFPKTLCRWDFLSQGGAFSEGSLSHVEGCRVGIHHGIWVGCHHCLQGFDDASSGDTAGAGVDGLYYLVAVEFNPSP